MHFSAKRKVILNLVLKLVLLTTSLGAVQNYNLDNFNYSKIYISGSIFNMCSCKSDRDKPFNESQAQILV